MLVFNSVVYFLLFYVAFYLIVFILGGGFVVWLLGGWFTCFNGWVCVPVFDFVVLFV